MSKKNQTEVSNDVHECGCSDYLPTREQIKNYLEVWVINRAFHFKQFLVDRGYAEYSETPLYYFIEFIRSEEGIDDEEIITAVQKSVKFFCSPSISTYTEDL